MSSIEYVLQMLWFSCIKDIFILRLQILRIHISVFKVPTVYLSLCLSVRFASYTEKLILFKHLAVAQYHFHQTKFYWPLLLMFLLCHLSEVVLNNYYHHFEVKKPKHLPKALVTGRCGVWTLLLQTPTSVPPSHLPPFFLISLSAATAVQTCTYCHLGGLVRGDLCSLLFSVAVSVPSQHRPWRRSWGRGLCSSSCFKQVGQGVFGHLLC